MRADLDRHPARDLAHRRQQRQRAVGELDGLVRDRLHLALHQRPGQLLLGGEMQIGEEQLIRLSSSYSVGIGSLTLTIMSDSRKDSLVRVD